MPPPKLTFLPNPPLTKEGFFVYSTASFAQDLEWHLGCTRSTIPKATPSLCTKPVALYSKIKRSKFSVLYTRRKVCKSFCVLLLLKEGGYLLSHILYIGILVVIGLNLLCVTEADCASRAQSALAYYAEVPPIKGCRAAGSAAKLRR